MTKQNWQIKDSLMSLKSDYVEADNSFVYRNRKYENMRARRIFLVHKYFLKRKLAMLLCVT